MLHAGGLEFGYAVAVGNVLLVVMVVESMMMVVLVGIVRVHNDEHTGKIVDRH